MQETERLKDDVNTEQQSLTDLARSQNWAVSYQSFPYIDGRPGHLVATLPAKIMVKEDVDLSIVIPLLNEEESLESLYKQLHSALEALGKSYEIIFIDDGSKDRSYSVLKRLHEQDSRVRVIRFRRNFGQSAAFAAGFDFARGAVIITMDADLQNDPADIPRLLAKIDEGYDVVSGWRVKRQDKAITRKLPSKVANALIGKVTGVKLHDYGCSLKAYRYDVVKNIKLYGEMHRFIPALASWMGIEVAEIPVNHHARQFGKSKYGLARIIKVVLDLLTVKFLLHYATRPAQIFGLLGMASLAVGSLVAAYLAVLKIFFNQSIGNRPLLLLAVLMIVFGVQLITTGLIGELLIRTYYEAQNKPVYVVKEMLLGDDLHERLEQRDSRPDMQRNPQGNGVRRTGGV
jgi:glycosyltransferase involved in cell wall biosynthesis